jgi:hypothetical protein
MRRGFTIIHVDTDRKPRLETKIILASMGILFFKNFALKIYEDVHLHPLGRRYNIYLT